MATPLFVSFEGGEGSGKSTQTRLLHDKLWDAGMRATLVHEPGTTPLGEYLRTYLKSSQPLTSEAELLLFEAARAELVNQRIEPSLADGFQVIADRFEASTVAYQGYGRRLDPEVIAYLNQFATGGRTPDLTFLLDLEPSEGLRRVGSPQLSLGLEVGVQAALPREDVEGQRRFEEEALGFHRRVRRGFLELAGADEERWVIIDATMPEEKIACQVWERVSSKLKLPTV